MTNPGEDRLEDDAALLALIGRGDQPAMARLFDRYGRAVYSVALRILRDTGHAEDVMQEIFFRIWRNPTSFVQERGSLGGWLVVMARNCAIDHLRRRKPSEPFDPALFRAPGDLSSQAEHNALLDRIRQILRDLPEEQRRSMELAYFEGLTHSEIAEKTGDPLGTVKTRIRLALTTLRKALAA